MRGSSFESATGIVTATIIIITSTAKSRQESGQCKSDDLTGFVDSNYVYSAYFTILQKVSASRLAPPTSAPSMFG